MRGEDKVQSHVVLMNVSFNRSCGSTTFSQVITAASTTHAHTHLSPVHSQKFSISENWQGRTQTQHMRDNLWLQGIRSDTHLVLCSGSPGCQPWTSSAETKSAELHVALQSLDNQLQSHISQQSPASRTHEYTEWRDKLQVHIPKPENHPHVIYPILKDLLDGYDNEDEKEGDDGRVPTRGGHIGDLLHSEGR